MVEKGKSWWSHYGVVARSQEELEETRAKAIELEAPVKLGVVIESAIRLEKKSRLRAMLLGPEWLHVGDPCCRPELFLRQPRVVPLRIVEGDILRKAKDLQLVVAHQCNSWMARRPCTESPSWIGEAVAIQNNISAGPGDSRYRAWGRRLVVWKSGSPRTLNILLGRFQ